ncbi:tetratricopeptide repeat protein [Methanospirillum sp.]|uniref:tetratricopeptide repeat protein n=1 Tax=Methanospirillum sp. TaxID=45200 RepID=UPI002987FBA8|nr:tetratricopeptide repeat protein [Methanospirillum sp.]
MKFVSTVLLSLSVLMLLFLCGCLGTEGWNAQDWIDQGSRFAKDELYVEAVDAYSHSIRLDPINPKVWTFRGIALQHLGRQQEAMNDFDEAIRLNPDESGAWQGKASSYVENGQYKLAIKAAERSLELAGPEDKKENSWLLLGFAYNRLEQYEKALQMFDKAIEIDPKRLDLWQHKAYTLTKLGRYMEVLKCYEVMTGIDKDSPELWNKKGEIHLALGQINEANNAFAMAKSLIEKN